MTPLQLQQLFSNSYNRTEWLQFLVWLLQNNLLLQTEFYKKPQAIALTKQEENLFTSLVRLGETTTAEGRKIVLYEAMMQPQRQVERNRVEINRLLQKNMLADTAEGALAVFAYAAPPQRGGEGSGASWRFSFVSHYIEFDLEKNTETQHQTALKRFTFLFGKPHGYRTAIERFSILAKSQKNLADFFAAFAVEPLSREFYNQLFRWYENALLQTTFNDQDEQKKTTHLIKIITRLIFIWFLKEKKLVQEQLFDEKKLVENCLYDLAPNSNSFYTAVLEKLFFEVLNKPIQERFAAKNYQAQNEIYTKNPEFLQTLLNQTPFVNGGLFDSHDSEVSQPTHLPKVLKVPNQLFFEEKENAKGLINLLHTYQFTAEENTPLETEVALDPELLGKIFENLLASVDQNTAQMARKATGSFYTPREIVDYMVVESLLAYLNSHLDKAQLTRLENLKNLEQKDEATKKVLLVALDKLKILDPACGSGAFPMGILHQLQDVLRQIDKDNKHWKESLISAFPAYLQAEMRKKLQGENLDYVRKLGIISKSIYGVDIQPIAIQITKLRCFLSLVIDQNTNENPQDNFGIKPLPNLEFKFVGANTLIGLGLREFYDTEGRLFAEKFEQKITDLQTITEKYFQTDQNGNSKATLQREFDKLQRELLQIVGDLTKQSPKAAEIAQKLLQWQPFEDTATTPFFDSYYMFGVKEGFDIVLGNPPYVQLQKMKAQQADFEKQGYKTYSKSSDLYCLFYEKGVQLLREKGILAYITSNSWMRTQYGELLRIFFVEHTNPLLLLNFEKSQVFESAIVESNILITQRIILANNPKNIQLKAVSITEEAQNVALPIYVAEKHIVLTELDSKGWIIGNNETALLKKKIENNTTLLGNLNLTIDYGIKTGFSEAFFIDQKTKDLLVGQNPKNAEIIKPFLRGRDLLKYTYNWANLYMITTLPSLKLTIENYPEIQNHFLDFGRARLEQDGKGRKKTSNKWFETQDQVAYWKNFSKPKIIWIVLSDKGKFAYDDKGYYTNDSCFIMTGENLKYLLAILNSKVAEWYFHQISTSSGMGTNMWKKYKVEQLPIKNIPTDAQQPFEILVDYVLWLKANASPQVFRVIEHNASLAHKFEALLDMMVFELYFSEEMKAANTDILQFVTTANFPPLSDDQTNEEKATQIGKVWTWLSEYENVIRNRMILATMHNKTLQLINGN